MAALGWLLNLDFAGSGAEAVVGGASFVTRVEEREPGWVKQWRAPFDTWRNWFRYAGGGPYGLRS